MIVRQCNLLISLPDFKMEIIMKKFLMLMGSILLLLSLYIGFKIFPQNRYSSKETAYYIVHSDMLKKEGGIVGIDVDGNITSQESLKIQDVSKCDLVGSTFIAGGNRANNHLFIDEQGNVNEFKLLDNSDYSGVTAITTDGENIVAVMNGNIEDNTYRNLLVIQDGRGNVLEKKIFDIFASDILCIEDTIYIVGSYLDLEKDQWSSKIIQYTPSNSKVIENIVDIDREYKEVILYDEKLYCSVGDVNGNIKHIDILDMYTLEKMETLNFDKSISSIFTYNDFLYGIFDNSICKIEPDGSMVELCNLPQDTYVNCSLINENHAYFFSRNDEIETINGYVKLGFLVDYNIASNEMRTVPLSIKCKNYDSIVFFPVVK